MVGDQDPFISRGLHSLCLSSKLERFFQQIKQQLKQTKVQIESDIKR